MTKTYAPTYKQCQKGHKCSWGPLSDGWKSCPTCGAEFHDISYDEYIQEKPRKPGCHYCGCDATGTGSFGEPVCPECGG